MTKTTCGAFTNTNLHAHLKNGTTPEILDLLKKRFELR
jgi:hypothetical protein